MSDIPPPAPATSLRDAHMNDARYISLLEKLIGETEFLQNNPAQGLVPQEDRACKHVLDALEPYTQANGGPLVIEHIAYVEGRGNLIITYPGTTSKTVAFVGSHLDVVPADPEQWNRDPFHLEHDVAAGRLYGRGTTDSLGHVCVLTELFTILCEHRPTLETSVVAVFIASEEGGGEGVGVDELERNGKLEHLKNGPIIWVDSADAKPCIGTASSIQWHLRCNGKLFHSGLPQLGINSIEMLQEATKYLQTKFYQAFPRHPEEDRYGFEIPSSMKPTQMECVRGSLNQIPSWAQASGDIRLTPFYEVPDVITALNGWVAELNADLNLLPTRCAFSQWTLPEGDRGSVVLTVNQHYMEGIACDLDSPGHKALAKATALIRGADRSQPFSIGGSLPLVKTMQRAGFDIQIVGFGLSSTYHANNEYSVLQDMRDGLRILLHVVDMLEHGTVNDA